MRRLLEIVLIQLLLLGCAIASEQQTTPEVLLIDVYSQTVPSDRIQGSDSMMWVQNLKDGKADPKKFLPVLEVEHTLGEAAFDIAKEAEPRSPPKVEVAGQEAPAPEKEAEPPSPPKVVVAGHVAPTAEQGAYRITNSDKSRFEIN